MEISRKNDYYPYTIYEQISEEGATKVKSLYKQAGVDLDKANELVSRIAPLVKSTRTGGVISNIGSFAGLYSINQDSIKQPVLVASTDGIGTKLKVAFLADRHDTVGIDLVAMCVNDILVQGAKPLFFLDYLAMGRLDISRVEAIIRGIAAGCREAGCALIGGETAEMPDFYKPGEYELAGFVVGVVDKDAIIDGSMIHLGDQMIGITSSGLHSNGFSLVRRIIFDQLGLKLDSFLPECNRSVMEELLEPTRIYVNPVINLLSRFEIHGMAHITGGGFYDNIARILPSGCRALVFRDAWEMPPIFDFLKKHGGISDEEMYRVFNCGIGYVLIVKPEDVEEILAYFKAINLPAFHIGKIEACERTQPSVVITEGCR